jgi:hypothetical protein
MWEAHGTIWSALYGSHVCYMGAVCTKWEMHAPYGSCRCHIGATCTIWELNALYESHMGDVNQMCTLRSICEPCAPYGDHMVPHGRWMVAWGSRMILMGAVWEPCGTMLHPIALYVPYGSHQA